MAIKLHKPAELPAPNGTGANPSQPVPLRPLAISGVCITKEALIEALRVYVPTVVDVEVVEDGERFLLTLAPSPPVDTISAHRSPAPADPARPGENSY